MNEIVGPESPTTAWQALESPWVVLPVGATEQHGPHLPVNSDILEAEYFARHLARDLGAGLLPAVPVLHSLEQTGFRGSLSLGLETGIALIRDIAEQLEAQNFTRLIILNFHGGNTILKPVAKDVNRRDGKLKIILLNGWEYDSSDEGRRLGAGEVHAGAWETSLMLAIHPELVGDYSVVHSPAAVDGAVQDDLAHLGFAVLRPVGAWGDPRRADAAAGGAIAASIRANLATAARRRLDWLDRSPSYGEAAGPVTIRRFGPRDIPRGLELCRMAGWNHREADWLQFLDINPAGCFAAVRNGRVVGTVTSTPSMGGPAWIALMLVQPEMRKQGVGKNLFRRALDALAEEPCVKLLATPEGYGLYTSHGFLMEDVWTLMVRPAGPPEVSGSAAGEPGRDRQRPPAPPEEAKGDPVLPMTETDLAEAAALDADTGLPSGERLLRLLYAAAPHLAGVTRDASGRLRGFFLGRPGENYESIGPLVARDADTAERLVRGFLRFRGGRASGMLTPPLAGWADRLKALGFQEKRQLYQMSRGENLFPAGRDRYAIAGPDFGY